MTRFETEVERSRREMVDELAVDLREAQLACGDEAIDSGQCELWAARLVERGWWNIGPTRNGEPRS